MKIAFFVLTYLMLISAGCCIKGKPTAHPQGTSGSAAASTTASPPTESSAAPLAAKPTPKTTPQPKSKPTDKSEKKADKKPDGKTAPKDAGATGEITLSWNPVAGAAWYNLYYGTKPGVTKASPNKITRITTTTHTVTGLSMGTTYYFVVTAGNEKHQSSESEEISGKPQKR